jgi:hypothetical protein
MSSNKPFLVSGRVAVTDYGNLTADRYEFLGLDQAEPNLGAGSANSVLTLGVSNTRVWSTNLTLTSLTSTGNISAGNVLVGNILIPTTGNVLVGNVNINNLANPVANSDAATKFYVDSVVANVLPAISNQTITPNGSANTFVLDQSTTAVGILLTINGITQTPTTNYTVTGNSLTMSETPLSSDIIQVRYLSGTTTGSGNGTNYANANVVAYAESGWGGNIIPQGNLVYNLGNSTNRWNDLYLSGNTIYLDSATISANSTDITFSGNVSANYITGDGSLLTGITANTGNVTFSGEAVIGTGTSNTVSGLYLAPDPGSLANSLYLRVRGNIQDEPTHIHFDTGNNQYYNQFIGDDLKYIQLANTGNIVINSNDSVGNTAQWNFGVDGRLTLPADGYIQALNNDGDPSSTISMRPNDPLMRLEQWSSQDSVSFSTADWATGTYTIDGGQGAVQFTDATNLINSLNALQGTGQIYFSVNGGPKLLWDGTSAGATNITFYTATLPAVDPTTVTTFDYYYSYNSLIEIDYDSEEFNIEANNVDLTISTTNQQDIELNSSRDMTLIANGVFSLTNYSNNESIYITTDASNGIYQWEFDNTGNLNLPRGGIVYETNIPYGGLEGNTIALAPSGGTNADQQLLIYPTAGNVDANHLHLTTGNLYNTELYLGNDDLYVKLANTGNVVVNSNDGAGNTAQWTFGVDGRLTFPGTPRIDTDGDNFEIQAAESINLEANAVVNIYTDTSGNAYQWQFGDDGTLTTPGGMIINGNINMLGTQTALLQATDDLPLSFIASGANGSVTSFWAEDVANLMTSNIAAIYTPLQNTQTVRIVTGNNGGNIAIYDFDNAGMFTAAAVCATGNVYAGNVSASGNVTGGNLITAGSGGDIALTGGNITGARRVVTTPTALANLTAVAGGRAFVNDANLVAVNNFGNLVGNGGSNVVPVWSDGSNWYIG